MKSTFSHFLGKLGSAIGRGMIAGLAGTAAFTISKIIAEKLTEKTGNLAPAGAASKALGIEAVDRQKWERFSKEVHWTYGTLWGIPRGMLSLVKVEGVPASALHFAAIFYTALRVEPDFEVAPPLNEWPKSEIAVFALHHLAYITVAGLVFDAINKKEAAINKKEIADKES